ncbi:sensor histidine kinase [Glycomyces xiaoerkulensis]|uniref:sensor histidine kinase n=1 Tax=Glycomyces xiaoerkulensis TaxID=2038139 RepID=UPI000C264DFF|nr:sensor histidine kinase [Glycomyces xiaoerkulensis]
MSERLGPDGRPGPLRRLSGRRLDILVAGLTLALSLGTGLSTVLLEDRQLGLGWLLLTIGPLSLLAWRRYPRTVMVASVLALAAMNHLDLGPLPAVAALFAIGFSMYRGARGLTVGTVLGFSVLTAFGNWQAADWNFTPAGLQQTMLVIGWLHVAMISGESKRQRDAYMEEAERTKEEALRRKAADERVRIARELHDALTHSISVIRVQAGVAVHLARKRGDRPPEALVAVDEAAKDATRELRETLTMLRGDEGPRLGRIKDLTSRYDGLGFEIGVDCPGCDRLEVGPDADHAAYRIVQEALTNAVRHSGGDRIEVAIDVLDDLLHVDVVDNGAADHYQPGRGITGMRERVDSLGGSLVVGPDAGGFAVRARLPAADRAAESEGTAA